MNYNNILLISEQTLKADSLINDNVDNQYILPAITLAQDTGLQPLIGTKLFQKLQRLVNDAEIGLAANAIYKTLLDDYVTPFMEYKTMVEIQIPLSYKYRNMGIVQTSDERVANSQMRDIQYLIDYYDNKSTFYANRMTDWLCANAQSLPEYRNSDTVADMNANNKAYNTGIFLG